ncbi:pyridoxal phosphate homeostasis protein [Parasteatoda tepidariorum]|uniref:pyridoxal phosphate homeostasis protein n=1 Tax=Parasteatoda tepidariorum TaxID=114398 RepID=UPI001C728CC1|nr:pyridoxal phosphate homeostasis protein [Parasteatoda tepidariorum]XP_042912326.1 pyridoxal phosphate homeostasis protein [Parasteatoda tepidariorum]
MASSEVFDMQKAIDDVLRKVEEAQELRLESEFFDVRVVAVSKTKPKEMIVEAYNCGLRHFGENYVNELVEKASDPEILEMCPEIKWHFIGHLQTNKVAKLLGIPNLYMVQTVDSTRLADALEQKWAATGKEEPLNIMIQVNTSGEEGKSGISPDQVIMHITHILDKCPHLSCLGLMTIGSAGHDLSLGPNPDFECLLKCRRSLHESPRIIDPEVLFLETCELSMGMSDDYEHAVELGSTCVRVGRCIFGARDKKEQ